MPEPNDSGKRTAPAQHTPAPLKEQEQSATNGLSAFARAREKRPATKLFEVKEPGTITGTGDAQRLNVSIAVKDLDKATDPDGKRIALAVTIPFVLDGQEFRLHGTLTLTAR